MTYLYGRTGDAFEFFHAQAGWEKATATAPWVTLVNYLRALTIGFSADLTHLVVVVEVMVTIILIYLLTHFWRQTKLDLSYKYYALANLALPIVTGSLGSMPRFSLSLFPLFFVIPTLSRLPRLIITLLFIVCCMLGVVLFTRGYWYA